MTTVLIVLAIVALALVIIYLIKRLGLFR